MLAAIAVALVARVGQAREVDPFTDRLFELDHLADASAVIDARMDELLASLADALNAARPGTPAERDAIVADVFQGSRIELVAQLRTPFEAWLRDDAPVDLFWVAHRGMYGGEVDYDDMGLAWYIESSPVIRIGPLLVGLDKIGHFLGQGWFYARRYDAERAANPFATEDELLARVRRYGHELEVGYQGLAGTGVYSYADLAANWQGFLFYRALWSGPSPYLVAANGRYRVARAFHIADHATDAWDEALNPSRPRSDRFFDKVARYLRVHACAAYRADPVRFTNASGRSQDVKDYVWDGATDATFACKRRFALDAICAR